MSREDKIYHLKQVIEEYEDSVQDLKDMVEAWEIHNDPGSDPGLQYEQSCLIDENYEKIKKQLEEL